MGLDEGDIVVRRRLAQKMEFLFKDLSAMTEPTEDDLRNYYTENRLKYETSPRMTFTQVYFSIDSRGVDGAKKATQTLIKEENARKVYGEIRSRYRVLVEGLPYEFDLKG
jgi:hypothetical protein